MRDGTPGHMYVTVTTTYPHAFGHDRMTKSSDLSTKPHGFADHWTVFADGRTSPPASNGGMVNLCRPAHRITFLKDTDGDGRADERKVLLSGLRMETPIKPSTFIWSPEGNFILATVMAVNLRGNTWGNKSFVQRRFSSCGRTD